MNTKIIEVDKFIQQELSEDGTPSGVEFEEVALFLDPFDPDSISIEPRVVPMDTLLRRLRQKSIRLAPTFQRKFVWDNTRMSQLIESLMLKIPLPMFYVAANEDGSWDVVDGLQRLTTIRNFLLGAELVDNDKKINPDWKPFALTNLEFWGERFNGMTFSEIEGNASDAKIVNNIMETEMRFTIINPGTPEEVKRNIFKRINTGGMPLTPQEIRHALYQGNASKLLMDLAELQIFREAIDFSINDSRMAARELILRYLAFSIRDVQVYSGDMDQFLSDTMRLINCVDDLSVEKLNKIFHLKTIPQIKTFSIESITKRFEVTMKRCRKFFGGYAFRKAVTGMRRTPVNKALFEAWANIFAQISESDFKLLYEKRKIFNENYKHLFNNADFERAISRDASSISGARYRYVSLNNLVRETLGKKND